MWLNYRSTDKQLIREKTSQQLPDGRNTQSRKQTNRVRWGRTGSRGAYLSTNCYIVVDTAVKRRQRVRSSRQKNPNSDMMRLKRNWTEERWTDDWRDSHVYVVCYLTFLYMCLCVRVQWAWKGFQWIWISVTAADRLSCRAQWADIHQPQHHEYECVHIHTELIHYSLSVGLLTAASVQYCHTCGH